MTKTEKEELRKLIDETIITFGREETPKDVTLALLGKWIKVKKSL